MPISKTRARMWRKEEKAMELLQECIIQFEYLNEKFGETGTTNSLLTKLKYANQQHEVDKEAINQNQLK